VTVVALQLPWMVAGLVVTESIFTWPGMGRLLWTAALQHDFPLVMAITMLVAIAVLFFNLLADVIYAYLDPRIAYA
jgi:peptide/nickel transport system permease protein